MKNNKVKIILLLLISALLTNTNSYPQQASVETAKQIKPPSKPTVKPKATPSSVKSDNDNEPEEMDVSEPEEKEPDDKGGAEKLEAGDLSEPAEKAPEKDKEPKEKEAAEPVIKAPEGAIFNITGDATLDVPFIGKILTSISSYMEKVQVPQTDPKAKPKFKKRIVFEGRLRSGTKIANMITLGDSKLKFATDGMLEAYGESTIDVPLVGKVTTSLAAYVEKIEVPNIDPKAKKKFKKRMVFEGKLKKDVTFSGITLGESRVKFATDGTFEILGSTKMLGQSVVGIISRQTVTDPATKETKTFFDLRGELVSKEPMKPFKMIPIPGVQDISIEKPYIGVILGTENKFFFGGKTTILGLESNVKLQIAGTDKISLVAVPPAAGWDISKASPALGPIKNLLNGFFLIASSYAYRDQSLGLNIKPGITFAAKIDFTKVPGLDKLFEQLPFRPEPCMFSGTLGAPKDIAFSASLPINLPLMSKELLRTSADIPKIVLKNLSLSFAGIPPEFSFKCGVEVTPRAADKPLLFTGAFTVDTTGQFGIEGSMVGSWINPFGIPGFVLEDVGLEFGARPNPPPVVIIPQRFGFTGTTIIGDRTDPRKHVRPSITAFFDIKQPQAVVFHASINHLTLQDILSIPANVGIKIPLVGVPDIGIEGVEISIAPLGGTAQIGEVVKTFPQGFLFKGKAKLLDKYWLGEFRINTALGLDTGVTAVAETSPFFIGPLKITGAGKDRVYGTKDDGPIFNLYLTPKKQELYISGLVDFFESRGNVEVAVSPTGLDIDTKLKLFNVFDTTFGAHINGHDLRQLEFDVKGNIVFGKQRAALAGHIGAQNGLLNFHLDNFSLKNSVEAALLLCAGFAADMKKTETIVATEFKKAAKQIEREIKGLKTRKAAFRISEKPVLLASLNKNFCPHMILAEAAVAEKSQLGIKQETEKPRFGIAPKREGLEVKEEELYKNLTPKGKEFVENVLKKVPDIKFDNVNFDLKFSVPEYLKKLGKDFEEDGIYYKSEMNIPALKLFGHAKAIIGRKGLFVEALMKKWQFGPLLITGKGLDKIYGTADDGPIAKLEVNPEKQELYVSGLVDIFKTTGAEVNAIVNSTEIDFMIHLRLINALEAWLSGKTLPEFKGFNLDGFVRIGKQKAAIKGRLKEDPSQTLLAFNLNKYSLAECVETVNDVIEGAIKIRPLPAKVIGFFNDDFEFENVNFKLAMSDMEVDGIKYTEGLSFDAGIIIPYVKLPVYISAKIDKNGLIASGRIPNINLGPLKVWGLGPDQMAGTMDDGPVIFLNISENPNFFIDGNVNIFGAESTARINISKTDISFKTTGKFANLFETIFFARSVGKTPQDFDFVVDAEFKNDFYKVIREQIHNNIKVMQEGATKGIDQAKKEVDKINISIDAANKQIEWRKNRIAKLKKIADDRIRENIAKFTRAQQTVIGERKKIQEIQDKITAARKKVIELKEKCNVLNKWYSWPAYLGCRASLYTAEAFMFSLERGQGASADVRLATTNASLEMLKGTAVLDPRNLPEAAEMAKVANEIVAIEAGKIAMITSREAAKGALELTKKSAVGFGETVKFFSERALDLEKILDIKSATLHGSLKDFVTKGEGPTVKLVVTTYGTTKTVEFKKFKITNPAESIADITTGLLKIAFTR